jgi:hypothetical protein
MSSQTLLIGGLAAALLFLMPPAPAGAEPRGLQNVGEASPTHAQVAHRRHQAIAAFRRRHAGPHAMHRRPGYAHLARPSLHRGFAHGPHRKVQARAAYGGPGAFRRAAYRSFDQGYAYPGYRPRVSYAPRYGLVAELAYRFSAPPVYGSTIAGPSPSLPLYNRPSCPCY